MFQWYGDADNLPLRLKATNRALRAVLTVCPI